MKPRILITSYYVEDSELKENRIRGVKGQDMTMCTCDYSDAVYEAGGIPLVLPSIEADSYCDELLGVADGVIFSGGEDVNPRHYGEEAVVNNLKVVRKRDSFELKLAKKILNSSIPVLGICRGMQLLNIAAGGNLYQDIYEQAGILIKHGAHKNPKDSTIHAIKIERNSRLYEIYKTKNRGVNSYHHQAINKLSDIYIASAYSEDGLIEGYEIPGKRFFVCVQWHPEMIFKKHKIELELFKALISACTHNK